MDTLYWTLHYSFLYVIHSIGHFTKLYTLLRNTSQYYYLYFIQDHLYRTLYYTIYSSRYVLEDTAVYCKVFFKVHFYTASLCKTYLYLVKLNATAALYFSSSSLNPTKSVLYCTTLTCKQQTKEGKLSSGISATCWVHCKQNTAHCTLYTTHYTLHTIHYTLYTMHCTLHISHCTLYTTHYTVHTVNCRVLQARNKNKPFYILGLFSFMLE